MAESDPEAIVEPDPIATPEVVVEDPAVPTIEAIASSDPDPVTQPDPVTPRETTPPETATPEADPPGPMIASSEKPEAPEQTAPVPEMLTEKAQMLVLQRMLARKNYVMVLDVQLTNEGRNGDAIKQAMELAQLDATSKKQVTDDFASLAQGVAGSQPNGEGEEATLLLLKSTAQKLDKFYIQLQRDLAGVAAVRLALPSMTVLDVVDEVTVSAQLVQHTEATLELFSDGEVVDLFAQQLQQLQYQPGNRANPNQLPNWGMQTEDGPVLPAQLLVLIR